MNPTPYTSFFEASLILAVGLPLFSSLFSLVISSRYSWITGLVSTLLLLASATFATIVLIRVWNAPAFTASVEWFSISEYHFRAGVLLNNQAALMLFVVCLISFLVHLFSTGYMAGDADEKRYFGMLGLFTFAMLGIVLADNLLLIFVFWELVGFSSYMLIGHWRQKPAASEAAKKAFLMNRIGDVGFLLGILIVWRSFGTLSLAELNAVGAAWSTVAALCLFCGVIGKSAQFPLFSWLPDAMEGPTPVSALIHAATMVAAGVYLLVRIFFIFSPVALAIVAIAGIITALIGAAAALVQNDIKKVLAYSTISQLGLMVTAVGAGLPEAALLHLFTHAFFKAALFLSAGSIIHALHQTQHRAHVHFDVQDIRNMGGLRRKLPFTFAVALVSGSALAGIPFFSGFLSKEAILSGMYAWRGDSLNGRWIIVVLAFVVSFLTVLYAFRFIYRVFFGEETATQNLPVTEPPPVMRAPLALLAAGSLWLAVSFNPFNPEGWILSPTGTHSWGFTVFSIGWVLFAVAVAYVIQKRNLPVRGEVLYHAFYIDKFYQWTFVNPVLLVSRKSADADRKVIDRFLHGIAYLQVIVAHLAGWFDAWIVDGIVNGAASVSRLAGSFTRSFQGGKIQLYIFWSLFTIIIFLIWSLI